MSIIKEINKKNPFLLVTLSISGILEFNANSIKPFYEIIKLLANKYSLIFAVDSGMNKSLHFLKNIKAHNSYIISRCGGLIYSYEKKEIIYMANLKNDNILRIFRQCAINFDTIIFQGEKKSFIFTSDKNLAHTQFAKTIEKTLVIDNYSEAIKLIRTQRIISIKIIFTYFDLDNLEERKIKIKDIARETDLIILEVSDGSFIISDIPITKCMDIILELENNYNYNYQILSLTNIFDDNLKSLEKKILKSWVNSEDVYKNNTFSLFNSELKRYLKEFNIL
ncbi:MAG: hypothetical protein ACRCW6_01295 [Mycoplasmoidaceae bacterium]